MFVFFLVLDRAKICNPTHNTAAHTKEFQYLSDKPMATKELFDAGLMWWCNGFEYDVDPLVLGFGHLQIYEIGVV